MAALLLSAAGAAAGSALFGPVGAIAGRLAGALAGSAIDQALASNRTTRAVEGPRLSDLDLMASTEGAPIARVYGRARVPGQLIWATQLEEVVSTQTETQGGGKGFGGPSVTTTTTTYSYFANIALGLCEGEIGRVLRVWADGKPLDLAMVTMRTYRGDDAQTVDPLIAAKEGAAPAYRGLAYVVFERLPLANFGNRIPQLSFELVRPIGQLEKMVRAVTLIPASTEFGYEPATVTQMLGPGQSAPENRHVTIAGSDVIASLDEHCEVKPGVEIRDKTTFGGTWSVEEATRDSAHLVSQVAGRPAYGGTPSDHSVVHLLQFLKARGRMRGLRFGAWPCALGWRAAGR